MADLKLAKKLAELMISADEETRAVADMIVAITPTPEAEVEPKPKKKQKRQYTKRKALGTQGEVGSTVEVEE